MLCNNRFLVWQISSAEVRKVEKSSWKGKIVIYPTVALSCTGGPYGLLRRKALQLKKIRPGLKFFNCKAFFPRGLCGFPLWLRAAVGCVTIFLFQFSCIVSPEVNEKIKTNVSKWKLFNLQIRCKSRWTKRGIPFRISFILRGLALLLIKMLLTLT